MTSESFTLFIRHFVKTNDVVMIETFKNLDFAKRRQRHLQIKDKTTYALLVIVQNDSFERKLFLVSIQSKRDFSKVMSAII